MKFKAHALFIVIIISAVIVTLLSIFIYTSLIYKLEANDNIMIKRLMRNVTSGFNYICADTFEISYNQKKKISLYLNASDTVEIFKKSWGLFDVAIITANSGRLVNKKAALIGSVPTVKKNFALYVADTKMQVYISGTSQLVGNCFLPGGNIEAINMEGFAGNKKLVSGNISKSTSFLPPINEKALDEIKKIPYDSTVNVQSNWVIGTNASDPYNSFYDSTKIFRTKQPLTLRNVTLKGNYIISSTKSITVDNSAILEDVILAAPTIKFSDGFNGTVQVVGRDTIITGRGCIFNYPSAFILLKSQFKDVQSLVSIAEYSVFKGIIFSYQSFTDLKKSKISMSQNTTVLGQVYVTGFAETRGKIYGSLACEKLFLKTEASIYENHLLNTVIDNIKLPEYFVGASLFSLTGRKKLTKIVK